MHVLCRDKTLFRSTAGKKACIGICHRRLYFNLKSYLKPIGQVNLLFNRGGIEAIVFYQEFHFIYSIYPFLIWVFLITIV
jgi:hypothetical protein